MVSLLSLIFTNPLLSFRLSYTFSAQVLIILLKSALLPYFPGYLSLRTQLQRAYLASAALHFPSFVHRLPVTHCPSDRARKVGTGWTGYVIPGRRFLSDFTSESPDLKRCVVLYAHGGGYAWGEARQYLNYMERWVLAASKLGIDLAFLSVEYRKHVPTRFPNIYRMSTKVQILNSSEYGISTSHAASGFSQRLSILARRRCLTQEYHFHGRLCRRFVLKLLFLQWARPS